MVPYFRFSWFFCNASETLDALFKSEEERGVRGDCSTWCFV